MHFGITKLNRRKNLVNNLWSIVDAYIIPGSTKIHIEISLPKFLQHCKLFQFRNVNSIEAELNAMN